MSEETPPELTIETVTTVAVEELNDDQKTFLKDNADNLSDEQKETYKTVLEDKEEEINPEEFEPETRTPAQIKKDKEEGNPPEEEDEIDPEDEKTISKVVEKRMKPVSEALQQLQKVKDEQEVDAFIRVKPEYAKYRDVMVKYVGHPAYAQIPVHNIAAIVASKDLQKLGAEKEREAAKKAEETKDKGNQIRKQAGGATDWKNVPKSDFEAKRAEVMGQRVA